MLGCLLCACGEDEPKSSGDDDKKPGTEQGGEKPDTPTPVNVKGKWFATCLVNGYVNGDTEALTLYLGQNNSGSLTVDEKKDGYKDKQTVYMVEYTLEDNGNTIICNCTDIADPNNHFTVTLEYRDRCLYPVSSELDKFVFGKEVVYTNIKGERIQPAKLSELLSRVWVLENGLNIMDLSNFMNPKLYQLDVPKSNECNFYLDCQPVECSIANGFLLNEINYGRNFGAWWFVEITEDKMVVRGENGKVDTYYPGSQSDIPQPTDFRFVLLNPKAWVIGDDDMDRNSECTLTFNEDGTFRFERIRTYETSGTYKLVGDELEMNFTNVNVYSDINGNTKPVDGFVNGQPCTVKGQLAVYDFGNIGVKIPNGNYKYFSADFRKTWQAAY